ncbi:hypothetical protein M8C21_021190, partial [Ambrosia artemisiifolia]
IEVMPPKQPNTGHFVGLTKGHVVTKKELARFDRKGVKTSKRVHFVSNLIQEVAGFAPYEKRITELLKVGTDMRALKVAKRKSGTHKRAKKKRERKCPAAGGGAEKKKIGIHGVTPKMLKFMQDLRKVSLSGEGRVDILTLE